MERPDWSPNSNKAGHPYGDVGKTAGTEAYQLLDCLSRPITPEECDQHGWHDADCDALTTLVDFDWLVPHIRATSEVSAEEMAGFDLKLVAFRAALPFTTPELNLLVKPDRSISPDFEGISDEVGSLYEEIVTAGVRRVVEGRDLLRRWLAWRREADEYTGQGTLDLAREALRGIVELLAPDEQLPASYRELRGISDPTA